MQARKCKILAECGLDRRDIQLTFRAYEMRFFFDGFTATYCQTGVPI
jgi:hypothetical protein